VAVTADLLIVGRIATLDGPDGLGWVEAMAVRGGRVVAAGTRDQVEATARNSTRRLVLPPDSVALPGLTDAHVHLLEGSLGAEQANLSGTTSLDDALAIVARLHATLPPDAWLEGGGWDPNAWGTWPTAAHLERVAPGRRVSLWAHDHHALLASPAALAEAGIDAATPDPPGGSIRRDAGAPTGVLHEHASRLVTARIPPPDADRVDRAVVRWLRVFVAHGVVAVQDMGPLAPDRVLGGAFAAVARLDEAGSLPVRVHAGIREESLDEAIERGLRTGDRMSERGRGRARVGWWKRFADGSLGSRTAYLRDPYEGGTGAAGERGLPLVDPRELAAGIARASAAGIVTAVHAIGDAAVDLGLGALGDRTGTSRREQPRPRIEHAQLLADDHLPTLAGRGIAVSMQPFHAASDAASIGPAWGGRTRRLGYRWRSVDDAGIALAFGTDAPVEDPNPWPGLAAAVDRTAATVGSSAPWLDPGERLSLERALRAATVTPARIAAETDRGTLGVGSRADVVIVDVRRGERLDDPHVLGTFAPRLVLIDGVVAFER
jgi:predicted amidohydrolase YtcJ